MEVSALKAPAAPGLRTPSTLLRLQSDERLIALIRRGQHAAFEALFARYHSRLLAFCRHMLGSKEDAEDVLQEVFAAAFNAILADEREINVRPWLYRIARNRSLNHLRRASAIGVDSMDTHFAEHGVSTAEKVLRRESFRQLIGDVQELPETQRTALLLREIDALSYEQIADAMETTVPAVKSLLVRARISLAEAAEARQVTCEQAREELGEVAEGLVKLSPVVRRHARECERCRTFRAHLKANNVALAAIMPAAPLLLLKKLVLTKFGSTAGAGGAHVAGAGGAGAVASATAAGGASAGGGLLTAGAGALATKAVAGLAVAAIVTAGTVEVDRASAPSRGHSSHAALLGTSSAAAEIPVVTHTRVQPITLAASHEAGSRHLALAAAHLAHKSTSGTSKKHTSSDSTPAAAQTPAETPGAAATVSQPTTDAKPPVTEVTTESTALPSTQSPQSDPATPTEPSTSAVTTPVNTPTTSTPATVPSTTTSPSEATPSGETAPPSPQPETSTQTNVEPLPSSTQDPTVTDGQSQDQQTTGEESQPGLSATANGATQTSETD